ncbi:hypothetical protein E2C01_037627 [Portunus trituberculatus]|uniref:Uncharacterized protein n=1 Tax=Portunus trituberculatus TaxID=210409 RepID=A0A5B7FG50_PORTR|nr:hypothetical protein [Portunus trituberculatus]
MASRHGTALHGTARHSTARHGTARHGTVRRDSQRKKLDSVSLLAPFFPGRDSPRSPAQTRQTALITRSLRLWVLIHRGGGQLLSAKWSSPQLPTRLS